MFFRPCKYHNEEKDFSMMALHCHYVKEDVKIQGFLRYKINVIVS